MPQKTDKNPYYSKQHNIAEWKSLYLGDERFRSWGDYVGLLIGSWEQPRGLDVLWCDDRKRSIFDELALRFSQNTGRRYRRESLQEISRSRILG